MVDLSQYVTVDSSGDYTVDTGAVASSAEGATLDYLNQAQASSGASWGDVNAALSETIGAMTAAVTLLAGAAAAGPLAPAALVLFGSAEALASWDPAKSGSGACYDCNGHQQQAPSSGNWAAWAQKTCCPECIGYNPGWYTIPGSGAKCHQTQDVGNGTRPSWAPDQFESFAEQLLLHDYATQFTFAAFLAGKQYNFARWPAILAMAIKSWNATHGNAGKATLSPSFLVHIAEPNTGGTRTLSVGATTSSFGGVVQPGTFPTETDPVSMALWFSQFSATDWQKGNLTGKIPAGKAIQAVVNNGPAIKTPASKGKPVATLVFTPIPPSDTSAVAKALATVSLPVVSVAKAVAPPASTPTSQLVATTPPAPSFWNKTLFTMPTAAKTPITVGETGIGVAVAGVAGWLVHKFL